VQGKIPRNAPEKNNKLPDTKRPTVNLTQTFSTIKNKKKTDSATPTNQTQRKTPLEEQQPTPRKTPVVLQHTLSPHEPSTNAIL
jgi:hypothetical protein